MLVYQRVHVDSHLAGEGFRQQQCILSRDVTCVLLDAGLGATPKSTVALSLVVCSLGGWKAQG